MSKSNAKIYREAARKIAEKEEEYSCRAVTLSTVNARLRLIYHNVFSYDRYILFWANKWREEDGYDDDRLRNCRVIALCFAAAMAEAGDL